MATKYAIYRVSDGALISHETDSAAQRLTDTELTALGYARKTYTEPTPDYTWSPVALDYVLRPPKIVPAKVRTPPGPFFRPSATPTNKDILDGMIVLYDLIMDLKDKS